METKVVLRYLSAQAQYVLSIHIQSANEKKKFIYFPNPPVFPMIQSDMYIYLETNEN